MASGKFSFSLAATQQNNVPFANANTLTAEDDWGNIVTTYSASANPVTITAAGVTGNVLGLGTGGNNILNQAGDFTSGVANLTLLGMKYLGTSGNATFTATSTSPAKTGISSAVTITPGDARGGLRSAVLRMWRRGRQLPHDHGAGYFGQHGDGLYRHQDALVLRRECFSRCECTDGDKQHRS